MLLRRSRLRLTLPTELFTICVLCYGEHFELASRCLNSLCSADRVPGLDLRIGLNSVCESTRSLACQLAPESIWESPTNRHKYPVMREMLHGSRPVTRPFTMWFDDDSFITQPLSDWLQLIVDRMQIADLLGSVYRAPWQGRQQEFVRQQAWYAGKDPAARPHVHFATGGWWTMRTPVLYKYDYPWPFLDHRGGDVLLGELCHQQNLRLVHFRQGVCINADAHGRESRSPRRGFDQKPAGY